MDGIQFSALGALRGFADVKIPAWIGFGGYWIVALSTAYMFAFILDMQGQGLWMGVLLGIATAAALLCIRYLGYTAKIQKKGSAVTLPLK